MASKRGGETTKTRFAGSAPAAKPGTDPPPSGARSKSQSSAPPSSRPPAEFVAWGPVRDALTSIHNLEALLRSPRISGRVLEEVLPEFLAGVDLLRSAFLGAAEAQARAAYAAIGAIPASKRDAKPRSVFANKARGALRAFTMERLDELEAAVRHATTVEMDTRARLALEQVVARVSVDLDAAAELLDLAERAENASPVELSLEGMARVSLQSLPPQGDREVLVRLDRARPDGLLAADPHVLTRLLAFAAARAHAAGAEHVTIRAACVGTFARIRVEKSAPGDAELAPLPMRLVRRIEPTDAIVESSAHAADMAIDFDEDVVTLTIPCAS